MSYVPLTILEYSPLQYYNTSSGLGVVVATPFSGNLSEITLIIFINFLKTQCVLFAL